MDKRITLSIRMLLRIMVVLPSSHLCGFIYGEVIHALTSQSMVSITTLWSAYRMHIWGILHATSYFPGTQHSLLSEVFGAYGHSLGLYTIAAAIAVLLGVMTGRWAIQRHQTASWMRLLASMASALPALFFASGSIAILYFWIIYTPWDVPLPLQGFDWDAHLVLPVVALGMRAWWSITHGTIVALADEYHKPHIVAGRARGLTERSIMAVHVWPAQHGNIATMCLAQLQIMIAELVIVEYLFHWQGIGAVFVSAVVAPQLSNSAPSPVYAQSDVIALCVVGFVSLSFLGEIVRIATLPRHEFTPTGAHIP